MLCSVRIRSNVRGRFGQRETQLQGSTAISDSWKYCLVHTPLLEAGAPFIIISVQICVRTAKIARSYGIAELLRRRRIWSEDRKYRSTVQSRPNKRTSHGRCHSYERAVDSRHSPRSSSFCFSGMSRWISIGTLGSELGSMASCPSDYMKSCCSRHSLQS
jgi:hypothetical protein